MDDIAKQTVLSGLDRHGPYPVAPSDPIFARLEELRDDGWVTMKGSHPKGGRICDITEDGKAELARLREELPLRKDGE
jgi:DNA-binding PadR family transcriptional regulator